jgi:putative membrane protein
MNWQRWVASAFAALAIPASAQTEGRAVPGTSNSETDPQEALRTSMLLSFLHQANQRETDMARLVMDRSDSEAIKAFADRLITDHQAADEVVKAFARSRNIDLEAVAVRVKAEVESLRQERQAKAVGSATGEWAFTAEPGLDPEVARLAMTSFNASLDKLRTLTGAALSREFVQAVIKDHQMVIDRTTHAVARINDPEVKSLAAKLLSVSQRHLTAAQRLQDRLSKS